MFHVQILLDKAAKRARRKAIIWQIVVIIGVYSYRRLLIFVSALSFKIYILNVNKVFGLFLEDELYCLRRFVLHIFYFILHHVRLPIYGFFDRIAFHLFRDAMPIDVSVTYIIDLDHFNVI